MRTVVLLLVVLASGCSFVFVDRPSTTRSQTFPDCTDSVALPWVDAGIASGAASAVLFSRAKDDSAAGLAYMALYGVSAFIGFDRVRDCKNARQRWIDAHATTAAPAWYPPPPPVYAPDAPVPLAPPHGPL